MGKLNGRGRPLAVLGGTPRFCEKLHVGRPNLGDRERFLARVNDMLDRRWLTNDGPFVQEFERKVAEIAGVRHCVAMCNATVALEIVIRALGLTGEVIVPSFTFIATAHALQWQQITPVFADIDERTHTLDPAAVERMVTPRTTGIIGVHLWGQPCDVEGLAEVARRHNLTLMFDAAHAFGCSHKGTPVGNFGAAEVFSFHATKFCNTLEGGAVVTNDDDLAQKMRLMRNFGFAGYDRVIYIGTNGKMDELSAAMGLTSLESLDDFVAVNRRHYHQYREELARLPAIRLHPYDEGERRNYQYVVLEINEDAAGLSRDELVEVLWAENVMARRYFYPGCHRMEPYLSYFPHAHLLLPTTEEVAGRVLLLPTGTAVSAEDVGAVCAILEAAVSRAADVRESLAARRGGSVSRPPAAVVPAGR
jgi:dTDP-4-amino-4,6-dideoxygalactose transaminase